MKKGEMLFTDGTYAEEFKKGLEDRGRKRIAGGRGRKRGGCGCKGMGRI